jgi:hypothetical protein
MKAITLFLTLFVVLNCSEVGSALTGECSLSGAVMSNAGEPLKSTVIAFRLTVNDGLLTPESACTTVTDPEGQYSCNSIPSGRYLVMAVNSTSTKNTTGAVPLPPEPYTLTFYPNVTDRDQALLITLHEGEHFHADLSVPQARKAASISGSIPDKPKSAQLQLTLHGDDYDLNTNYPVLYDSSSGRFGVAGVPEGLYQLTAHWSWMGSDSYDAVIVAADPATTQNLILANHRPTRVDGKIRWNEGLPLRPPTTMSLQGIRDSARRHYLTRLDSAGSFSFPGVREGKYVLSVEGGDGQSYVQSISLGSKQLPGQDFTVPTDTSSMYLDAELSSDAGSIAGAVSQVATGKDKTRVVVESLAAGTVISLNADSRGQFVVTGLSPGGYRIYAWPGLTDVEYRNPHVLKQYANDGISISVDEGIQATGITVPLIDKQLY